MVDRIQGELMQEYTKLVCGLLGTGKTGKYVQELAPFKTIPFNSKHPILLEKIQETDFLISFLPPAALEKNLEVILESQKPLVSGTTGFIYENVIPKAPWIIAPNFSIPMLLIKRAIENLRQITQLIPDVSFEIYEKHHSKKRDSPSGTALLWEDWTRNPCKFQSDREGDEIGLHKLLIKTPYEDLVISHQSKSRALFAQGAIFACKLILKHKLKPGKYDFHQLIEKDLL